MSKAYHKKCIIPVCNNNFRRNPDKMFISVPSKPDIRRRWLELAKMDLKKVSSKAHIYFCGDHFDLPKDMENYMELKIMGKVKRIRIKKGSFPSNFDCQDWSKRKSPPPLAPLTYEKRIAAILDESVETEIVENFGNDMENHQSFFGDHKEGTLTQIPEGIKIEEDDHFEYPENPSINIVEYGIKSENIDDICGSEVKYENEESIKSEDINNVSHEQEFEIGENDDIFYKKVKRR